MINHIDLGKNTEEQKKKLSLLIRSGAVTLGGYKKTKIYGLLSCSSGKRMKAENRVFLKMNRMLWKTATAHADIACLKDINCGKRIENHKCSTNTL
jgi:hypothetical protein